MPEVGWKGDSADSLDEHIQSAGIDPTTCPNTCLEGVSKICTTGHADGTEKLTFFFKCPSWENEPRLYCQQALEG